MTVDDDSRMMMTDSSPHMHVCDPYTHTYIHTTSVGWPCTGGGGTTSKLAASPMPSAAWSSSSISFYLLLLMAMYRRGRGGRVRLVDIISTGDQRLWLHYSGGCYWRHDCFACIFIGPLVKWWRIWGNWWSIDEVKEKDRWVIVAASTTVLLRPQASLLCTVNRRFCWEWWSYITQLLCSWIRSH